MKNLGPTIGAIFLIIGTAIGGGMLALPVVTASAGFWVSALYLTIYWLMMTTGAFFLLELSLRFPPGTDLITLAKHSFGHIGKVFTWIIYLGLLYTLLSAYMAGGGELITHWLSLTPIKPFPGLGTILFTIVMGTLVCWGMQAVDKTNRAIMSFKLIALVLLFIIILPLSGHTHSSGQLTSLLPHLMVIITAFGFAIVIPSLRSHLGTDKKRLRIIVLIGSLIPLICYLLWEAAIFSVIPQTGPHSLAQLAHTHSAVSLFVLLTSQLHSPFLNLVIPVFTSLCLLTSFLGVGISLLHFLSDGIPLRSPALKTSVVRLVTFIPPMAIVLWLPSLFIYGLRAAGFFCVLLLVILPITMMWRLSQTEKKHWIFVLTGIFALGLAVFTLVYFPLVNS